MEAPAAAEPADVTEWFRTGYAEGVHDTLQLQELAHETLESEVRAARAEITAGAAELAAVRRQLATLESQREADVAKARRDGKQEGLLIRTSLHESARASSPSAGQAEGSPASRPETAGNECAARQYV